MHRAALGCSWPQHSSALLQACSRLCSSAQACQGSTLGSRASALYVYALAGAFLLHQPVRPAGRQPVAVVAGQQVPAECWYAWSCPWALMGDPPSITLPSRSWATAES